MARRLNRRQQRITDAFDDLCAAIATALGAADGIQDAAAQAHATALVEMWLREAGLDAAWSDPGLAGLLANPQLAPVVDRVVADRGAAFADWLRTGPGRLTALMDEAAPGAAGVEPPELLTRIRAGVSADDGVKDVPGLWRIGTGQIGTPGSGDLTTGGVRLRPSSRTGTVADLVKQTRTDPRSPSFPVGVPLLDAAHLRIVSTRETRAEAATLIETLLMRLVTQFVPGLVRLHVWDVGQFTGVVPGLFPLTRSGLLTVHDPGRLPGLLNLLSDHIRRVHGRLLIDGFASLRDKVDAERARIRPWIVAVLVGNGQPLGDEEHWALHRIARGGPASGVHLVLLDVPVTPQAQVEEVRFTAPGVVVTSMTGPHVVVTPDPPVERALLTDACNALAGAHERGHAQAFADLLPENWETATSAAGLTAPIGFADGMPVDLVLADASPHALIGGPSGTGKTNLLLAMISSMAARYGPDELEFYLLDFKEGVSFAQFARGRRDPTWLPHARLIGVNVNTDREFGLALLRFLSDEMRHRAEAAKDHEVSKLEELRAVDPDGRWPRIVAVIDEFQFLFSEKDTVTRQAASLLEDVARRGRSQGIHLVLASQDVSGIDAFWGRPGIFEQFVLRIGLPRARRVLAERNDATLDLPRWHAVVNHDSGERHGNEVVRIPDATTRGTTDLVQRELFTRHADEGRPEPVLFDGSRAPHVDDLVARLPAPAPHAPPRAVLGQCIDVRGRAAVTTVADVPGRNLAVLGAGSADAVRVLGSAAVSLTGEYPRGGVDVVVAPLVPESYGPAGELGARLAENGQAAQMVYLDGLRARIDALAADVTARLSGGERRPVLLVLYGADAAESVLGNAGLDSLRRVLRSGPETGVHVLGWWRGVSRLRATLGITGSVDDIGAWVALDVQGSELNPFAGGMMLSWSPRPGRGLFYDRARHSEPEVVIVSSVEPREGPAGRTAGERTR